MIKMMANRRKKIRTFNPYTRDPPGYKIYCLRFEKGWSQYEAGEKCGLDHTTIRRLELNKGYTQDTLELVAKVYDVTVPQFFCDCSGQHISKESEEEKIAKSFL